MTPSPNAVRPKQEFDPKEMADDELVFIFGVFMRQAGAFHHACDIKLYEDLHTKALICREEILNRLKGQQND